MNTISAVCTRRGPERQIQTQNTFCEKLHGVSGTYNERMSCRLWLVFSIQFSLRFLGCSVSTKCCFQPTMKSYRSCGFRASSNMSSSPKGRVSQHSEASTNMSCVTLSVSFCPKYSPTICNNSSRLSTGNCVCRNSAHADRDTFFFSNVRLTPYSAYFPSSKCFRYATLAVSIRCLQTTHSGTNSWLNASRNSFCSHFR